MTGESRIQQVGFFRSAEEIAAAASTSAHPWEPQAMHYLKHGAVVMASPHWVDDQLNTDIKGICSYSLLTDGAWVWPSDLVYYVRKYHVELPAAFLSHMASRGWVVGGLDSAAIGNVVEKLWKEWGVSVPPVEEA